jgi:hypothetical protein
MMQWNIFDVLIHHLMFVDDLPVQMVYDLEKQSDVLIHHLMFVDDHFVQMFYDLEKQIDEIKSKI